jgi:hypothetical protein
VLEQNRVVATRRAVRADQGHVERQEQRQPLGVGVQARVRRERRLELGVEPREVDLGHQRGQAWQPEGAALVGRHGEVQGLMGPRLEQHTQSVALTWLQKVARWTALPNWVSPVAKGARRKTGDSRVARRRREPSRTSPSAKVKRTG